MKQWSLPAADTYFRPLLTEAGFQIDHLLAALRFVTHWRTAVDGGAHIGTWSVEMAKHFQRVLAFEPAADTFACLEENVRGLLNVECSRAALGSLHTYGEVVDDPERPGNTGARFLRASGAGPVLIRRLDEYGLEDLDLLKLDVEGFELEALTGAVKTVERCRPVIVAEFKKLRPGVDPEAAADFLLRMGYSEAVRTRNDRVYVYG